MRQPYSDMKDRPGRERFRVLRHEGSELYTVQQRRRFREAVRVATVRESYDPALEGVARHEANRRL